MQGCKQGQVVLLLSTLSFGDNQPADQVRYLMPLSVVSLAMVYQFHTIHSQHWLWPLWVLVGPNLLHHSQLHLSPLWVNLVSQMKQVKHLNKSSKFNNMTSISLTYLIKEFGLPLCTITLKRKEKKRKKKSFYLRLNCQKRLPNNTTPTTLKAMSTLHTIINRHLVLFPLHRIDVSTFKDFSLSLFLSLNHLHFLWNDIFYNIHPKCYLCSLKDEFK